MAKDLRGYIPLIDNALRRAGSKILYRGRSVYNFGISNLFAEEDLSGVTFEIESQSGYGTYEVKIKFADYGQLSISCTCPYDWGGICKHEVAALIKLRELITSGKLAGKKFNQEN